MEELERHGFTDLDNKEIYNPESIEKLTYITYVVKESLRIDCPTYQSLEYAAYEDVEIAGVPFKKGTTFFKDSSIIHYDPEEYFEPLKFIPERFDPEHKYFFRPSDGKARRPYSNVPFSYGSRACPGQTFAMLELKVTLAYILTHAEYSIPEDILKSETIGFAIGSTFECPLKISKVNK